MADNNMHKQPSPLVELPAALREQVYDMLEVRERVVLNAVLPRAQRVERTTRDRKLALAWRGFKAQRKPVPSAVEFLEAAAADGDPTATRIVDSMRAQSDTATTDWSEALMRCCEGLTQALMRSGATGEALKREEVVEACAPARECPDVKRAAAHLDDFDMYFLLRALARHAKASDVDVLLQDHVSSGLLCRLSRKYTLITVPLCEGNAPFVRELLARGVCEQMQVYFVSLPNTLASFMSYPGFLRTAFAALPLGQGVANELLGIAIDTLNVEAADVLERELGAKVE